MAVVEERLEALPRVTRSQRWWRCCQAAELRSAVMTIEGGVRLEVVGAEEGGNAATGTDEFGVWRRRLLRRTFGPRSNDRWADYWEWEVFGEGVVGEGAADFDIPDLACSRNLSFMAHMLSQNSDG